MQRRPVLITACLLFIGMWLLLSATSAGHLFVADEICYFYMARSFVDHGTFDVPSAAEDVNVRQAQPGKDGKYYVPHSFGHALYLAPWVGLGRLSERLIGKPWAPIFAFSFAHSLTMALAWTLFFLILIDYRLSVRRALVFTLASLVSTLAFPYARSLFAEPVVALGLTAAWLCFRRRAGHWFVAALIGGAFLTFCITVRPTTVVLLPGFWLLAWQQVRAAEDESRVSRSRWLGLVRLGAVVGASLAGLILFSLYNYTRFGAFLTIGYPPLSDGRPQGFTTPLWFGLMIFLASPGKALWLFNPLLVLSAVGWRRLWGTDTHAAGFVAWSFLSNLVIHSLWTQPEGGICWGPRFFVGVLPILLLPAALFWGWARSSSARYGMAGLVVVGLLVQAVGISVNYSGVLLFESMVPPSASKAVYYKRPDTYNLAFSPFPAHVDKLASILSAGGFLRLRPEGVRLASDRSATHSFPFWFDAIDVWAIHLVKDGYRASRVMTLEVLLLLSGFAALTVAYRRSRAMPPEDANRVAGLAHHTKAVSIELQS